MPRYVGRSSCIRVFPIANIPNEHARRLASKMHMEVVVSDSLRERVIENIRFGELIAQGANGTITEGKWEGSIVAVKKIHSVFNEPSEFDFKLLDFLRIVSKVFNCATQILFNSWGFLFHLEQ